LTETANTEIKTCIQRRHLAHAPPWSSSTGSSGRHASESMVAFSGMRISPDGIGEDVGDQLGSFVRNPFGGSGNQLGAVHKVGSDKLISGLIQQIRINVGGLDQSIHQGLKCFKSSLVEHKPKNLAESFEAIKWVRLSHRYAASQK
jgi:hypothetical protein